MTEQPERQIKLADGPVIIEEYSKPDYFSTDGVCPYHKFQRIIGTYNQLAEHLVEDHYDIWLQVQEAHGMSPFEIINIE